MHRTQSEEPPRSPFETNKHASKSTNFYDFDQNSNENLTHSRNLSQDSFDSVKYNKIGQMVDSAGNFTSSFSESDGTMGDMNYYRSYESNSLPRQKCEHHKPEFHTYSLPRKDPYKYHFYQNYEVCSNANSLSKHSVNTSMSQDLGSYSTVDVKPAETNIQSYSRPIMPTMTDPKTVKHVHVHYHQHTQHSPHTQHHSTFATEDCSSTVASEEAEQQQEIFIDFKPRISPISSPPQSRKTRLQKTLSEGEILYDKRREEAVDGIVPTLGSASEEDLKTPEESNHHILNYSYSNVPIKDEGICDNHLLKLPQAVDDNVVRNRRESFRKRSISLEDGKPNDGEGVVANNMFKAIVSPLSPCLDEYSSKGHSDFASSDSLSNEITRDHSDGIWNESQATVLHADPTNSAYDAAILAVTPSAKRKNLLLQHQQRSSMDTEALEMEDQYIDTPISSALTMQPSTKFLKSSNKCAANNITAVVQPVMPSLRVEEYDQKVPTTSTTTTSTLIVNKPRPQIDSHDKKKLSDHIYFNM